MTGIDADHRQTERSEFVPKPSRGRAGLEADALRAPCLCPEEPGKSRRLREHRAFRHNLAAAVDHANCRLFEQHIQSNIDFHSCSPDRSSRRIWLRPDFARLRRATSRIEWTHPNPRVTPCVKTLWRKHGRVTIS